VSYYYPGDFVDSYKRRRGESKDSHKQRMLGTNSREVNKYSSTPRDGRGVRKLIKGGQAFPEQRRGDTFE
jgi:hypothetical protein